MSLPSPTEQFAEKAAYRPNPPPLSRLDRLLSVVAAAVCTGLLAYKFALVPLQNVNWDEFYFLSHVYSLARGELSLFLLGAYTHLFGWLTRVPGDEIRQIVVARYLMTGLLGLTAWLIWRLARVWTARSSALLPSLLYLSAMPVLLHGGSFRYDSMLAPLSMGALLLLIAPPASSRKDTYAGILLGIAFVLTIKTVLFAPLIATAIAFRNSEPSARDRLDWTVNARIWLRVALAAGITAAILLALHWSSISPASPIESTAANAARTTLIETPWFPRVAVLHAYFTWQPLGWILMALGTIAAIARRNYCLASLSMALLPVAFYRNAFPYYYLVMLAPAVILAGYAIQELVAWVRLHASASTTAFLLVTVWSGALYQALAYAPRLYSDGQQVQQQVLNAVHRIFASPVNYIDRCAMVPSFRKVGFFMSSWGLADYRAAGTPVMTAIIRDSRPAFLIVNTAALNTADPSSLGLLDPDREVLNRFYPWYWGPIRVAGGLATPAASDAAVIEVPFPGRYRIESARPVLVDGIERRHGDVVQVDDHVTVRISDAAVGPTVVRLVLAIAAPPPAWEPGPAPIFQGL